MTFCGTMQFARTMTVCAAVSLSVPGAVAAEPEDWATIGGWDISYYPGAGGCQALALFEEDTAFFIGYGGSGGARTLEVTLLDRRWTGFELGREYAITARFGVESSWTLAMQGVRRGAFPGLVFSIGAETDQAQLLVEEIRKQHWMTWSQGDDLLGRFSLKASSRALDAVGACQQAHEADPVDARKDG